MTLKFIPEDGSEAYQRRRQAELYVIDSAFWSVWSGLMPFPLITGLYTATIQPKMIYEICVVYDVPYSEQTVNTLVAALGAGVSTGLFAYVVLRALPGVGNASVVLWTAVVTYAIGHVFIDHFERGGNLDDFAPESMGERLRRGVREGWQWLSQRGGATVMPA